jgi:hypothetical protein
MNGEYYRENDISKVVRKRKQNAWGCNWATFFLGEIYAGTWPSKLGGLNIDTVIYYNESHRTTTRERLRWLDTTAAVSFGQTLTSERASHNKTTKCRKIISKEEKQK